MQPSQDGASDSALASPGNLTICEAVELGKIGRGRDHCPAWFPIRDGDEWQQHQLLYEFATRMLYEWNVFAFEANDWTRMPSPALEEDDSLQGHFSEFSFYRRIAEFPDNDLRYRARSLLLSERNRTDPPNVGMMANMFDGAHEFTFDIRSTDRIDQQLMPPAVLPESLDEDGYPHRHCKGESLGAVCLSRFKDMTKEEVLRKLFIGASHQPDFGEDRFESDELKRIMTGEGVRQEECWLWKYAENQEPISDAEDDDDEEEGDDNVVFAYGMSLVPFDGSSQRHHDRILRRVMVLLRQKKLCALAAVTSYAI